MNQELLPNPHVGEFLKEEFLILLKISQNALAKAIHVPANRIHQIVRGERRVTADTDLRLCRFFRLSEGHFLRYQILYEMREVKRKHYQEIKQIKPFQHQSLG